MLHPGQVIKLPVVGTTEAANPHFSQRTWNTVLALNQQVQQAKQQEELKKITNSPEGMELALNKLGEGSLTTEQFYALFPHIDLANAIYASYPGNLDAGMVTELWTQGQVSQQVYTAQQQTSKQLDNHMQEFQAGLISRGELQHMYPHLNIDQALGLIGNPAALYNQWMREVGRATTPTQQTDQRGWDATAARYQGLAEHYEQMALQAGYAIYHESERQAYQSDTPTQPDWIREALRLGPQGVDTGLYYHLSQSLEFTARGNYTSVSVNPNLPSYTRLPFQPRTLTEVRHGQGYLGTRYLNSNIPPGAGLRWAAKQGITPKLGVLSAVSAFLTNAYDFTFGEKVGGDEVDFVASTAVDFGVNLAIGVGAALVIAGLAAAGLIAAPFVLGATAVASIVIGFAVDSSFSDQIEQLKVDFGNTIRDWQATSEND